MAKSLRSKRQKRLRTLRREIAQPFYDNKEIAKLAAQEAALAAPKVPVRSHNTTTSTMTIDVSTEDTNTGMDLEMADGAYSETLLKPVGGIGKKGKKNSKTKNKGRRGKGKFKRKKNI